MLQRFLFVFLLSAQVVFAQTQRPLSAGVWYKIAVDKTGVYRLDADFFRKNKINLKGFSPKNFRIYVGKNGMLPQANNAVQTQGLSEMPIQVQGEEDGAFDKQDAILFYAESSDDVLYLADKQSFSHQKNLYSTQNYVFLELSQSQGLRIKNAQVEGDAEAVSTFVSYIFEEKDVRNIVNSGREWMGENLSASQPFTLNFKVPGLVQNSAVLIRSETMVATTSTADVDLSVGGKKVFSHGFDPVGSGRFDIKGRLDFKTAATQATQRDSVSVRYDFKPAPTRDGLNSAVAYLNFVGLQTERYFQNFQEQTSAFLLPSKAKKGFEINFKTETNELKCWNVSDLKQIDNQLINDKKSKVSSNLNLTKLHFFSNQNLFTPKSIELVQNQNLEVNNTPDFLIISAPNFKPQAFDFAKLRQDDGLTTAVVTTDEIYNELSGGRLDPVAIRNFIRFLYNKNPAKLKYVLLLGDATFDFRNIYLSTTYDLKSIVPTYESRESFHPVRSFSSDDFYGFMDANEGEWEETSEGNHTLDLAVGRLPVKTPDEARIMLEKLKTYSYSKQAFGPWRLNYSFLADDGDYNIHQQDAEDLSASFERKSKAGITQKIYVDAFPQRVSISGALAPAVNEEIRKNGLKSLIVNYNGHGGTSGFAEEKIITIADILSWKNKNHLPLLFTATCDFGRFDSPVTVSGAELALLNQVGGAIALCSTTRPVYSTSNFVINEAFFNAIGESSDQDRLGDLIRKTKNNGLNDVYNRNFSLLGDPTLKLARPKLAINIAAPDTLRALEKVKLFGNVDIKDFNGKVIVSVYDKAKNRTTFGTESAKFDFQNIENKLFEQVVDVKNSRFELEFILPKNIDYRFGRGLISCYAVDADSTFDLAGFNRSVVIGGTSLKSTADETPPKVSFAVQADASGDISKQSELRIDFTDESGFSIMPSLLGQDPELVFDDTLKIQVSDFIKLSPTDFRKGAVSWPLNKIQPGNHKVDFRIRDTHNNLANTSFKFRIDDSNNRLRSIAIPNPFTDVVLVEVENLIKLPPFEANFRIFNEAGQVFFEQTEQIVTAEEKLYFRWRPAENIPAGKYIYGIVLKSNNQAFKTSGGLIFSK